MLKEFHYDDLEEFGVSDFVKEVVENCKGLDSCDLPPLIAPEGYLLTKEEHKILREAGYDMFVPELDGDYDTLANAPEPEYDETLDFINETESVDSEEVEVSERTSRNANTFTRTYFRGQVVVVGNQAFWLSTPNGGTVGSTAGGLMSQVTEHLVQSNNFVFPNVRRRLFRRTDGRYMANTWVSGLNANAWEELWTVRVAPSTVRRQNQTGGVINVRRRPHSSPDGYGAVVRTLPHGYAFNPTHTCVIPVSLPTSNRNQNEWRGIPNNGTWFRRASQEWMHHSTTVRI